jgi:hypothetical protein
MSTEDDRLPPLDLEKLRYAWIASLSLHLGLGQTNSASEALTIISSILD